MSEYFVEKIYSKKNAKKLLHVIWRAGEGEPGKLNFIIPEEECLQVSAGVGLPEGHSFGGAHKHLPQERNTSKTQESLILIKGSAEVEMFDTDDEPIGKEILEPGDCYIYLGGGHSLRILSEGTFFYEIKNGPYYGRDKDKKLIK